MGDEERAKKKILKDILLICLLLEQPQDFTTPEIYFRISLTLGTFLNITHRFVLTLLEKELFKKISCYVKTQK